MQEISIIHIRGSLRRGGLRFIEFFSEARFGRFWAGLDQLDNIWIRCLKVCVSVCVSSSRHAQLVPKAAQGPSW